MLTLVGSTSQKCLFNPALGIVSTGRNTSGAGILTPLGVGTTVTRVTKMTMGAKWPGDPCVGGVSVVVVLWSLTLGTTTWWPYLCRRWISRSRIISRASSGTTRIRMAIGCGLAGTSRRERLPAPLRASLCILWTSLGPGWPTMQRYPQRTPPGARRGNIKGCWMCTRKL